MRKNTFIWMFICSLWGSIIGAQSMEVKSFRVADIHTGNALSQAFCSSPIGESTLSNEDGIIQFKTRSLRDTLWTIKAWGYHEFTGKVDSVIHLVPWKTSVESSIDVIEMLEQSLKKIPENFDSKPHYTAGFYAEKIWMNDQLQGYNEGLVQSFKHGYHLPPSIERCLQTNSVETSISRKANSITFSDLPLPLTTSAYLLPKTHDPLSACLSPLIDPEALQLEYQYTAMSDQEPIVVVSFRHKENKYHGEMAIGKSTSNIYKVKVEINENSIVFDSQEYSVKEQTISTYSPGDTLMVLSHIDRLRSYQSINSNDTIEVSTVYVRGRNPVHLDSLPSREELLQRSLPNEEYISLNPQYYYRQQQIIARDRATLKNIGKGKSIRWNDGSQLSDLLVMAQKEEKLLFLMVGATGDAPSQRMLTTSFANQALVSYLENHFLPASIDLAEHNDHPIIYQTEMEFLPTYVIMTPLGQIVDIWDGYEMAPIILEKLKEYDGFSVPRLFYAYDRRKGSDKDKIKEAYLDLFYQLDDLDHPAAGNMVSYFEKENKNWETTDAKRILFKYLIFEKSKYRKKFLKELDYYERTFGHNEVGDRMYELAFEHTVDKGLDRYHNFEKYLEKNSPSHVDSLYPLFLMDYFSRIRPNKDAYLSTVVQYYTAYHHAEWNTIKSHLMTVVTSAEKASIIQSIRTILDNYRAKAIDYEWLDLQSMWLYRNGNETEAISLIEEIQKLALQKGMRYEPALVRLAKKKREEAGG